MASQYALRFSLPERFPAILKEFSQEILHAINMEKKCGSTSAEIYRFASDYFANKAAQNSSSNSSVLSAEEVEMMARQLFVAADADESGSLDQSELQAIMEELASSLGFTKKEDVTYVVKSVMDVADVDANGVISYQEFLPVATDIVQSIYSKVMERKTSERTEMQQLVAKIFQAYDTDQSGALDQGEFNKVFKDLADELGLGDEASDSLASQVMDAADVNADGQLSLDEFMPLCVEILQTIIDDAENDKFDSQQDQSLTDEYTAAAEDILIGGMTGDELEQTLLELFKDADLDGSGTLERPEFAKCLVEADIGLTQEHVDVLMQEVDENGDGVIDFNEFAPLAYKLLVEVMARQLQEEDEAVVSAEQAFDQETLAKAKALVDDMDQDELSNTLISIFAAADKDGSGELDQDEFRSCLMDANLPGINEQMVDLIMFRVDKNEDGVVTYREFAPLCYEILVEVVNMELKDAVIAEAEAEARNEAELAEAEEQLIRGFSEAELNELLSGVFEEADKDSSKHLDPEEFKNALMLSSDLGLTDDEADQVLEAVDVDGDGTISYDEFLPVAFRILTEIVRDEIKAARQEAELAEAARTDRAEQTLIHNMTHEELETMLMEIFHAADSDGSGTLEPGEFTKSLLDSDVEFTEDEINLLREGADTDENGTISFSEFAPLAYDLLVEHVARALDAEDQAAEKEENARLEAKELLVKGMSREELQSTLYDIFKQHDKDNSGKLDREEFLECLNEAQLNLSVEEISYLQTQIDENDDGQIDFDEFAPLCFDMLVEVMTKQIVESS